MLSLIREGICMAAHRSGVGGLVILQRCTASCALAHFDPTTITQEPGGVQDFRAALQRFLRELYAACSVGLRRFPTLSN